MRKIRYLVLLLLFVHTLALAQNVSVSGALVGNGSYATLKDAFAAINGGVQTGTTITISILNDTYEGTGTAILNAGTWSRINILPVGQARSIIGATTPGQPMIDLNGADRVHFIGLLGGQQGLTLYNTTNSTTTGTSTLRLRNAASLNTLKDCKILGASRTQQNAEGGNVVFGNAGAGGNSNNSIKGCLLSAGSPDLPSKLVFCGGSMNTSEMNAGDTLSNCDFADCFGTSLNSASIMMLEGGINWRILNNRFYQTALRTKIPSGGNHYEIYVSGVYGNFLHQILNNIIGSQPAPWSGSTIMEFQYGGSTYNPIYLGNSDYVGPNTVMNNIIRDIQIHCHAVTGSSSNNLFIGVRVPSSSAIVSANLIGSTTSPGSIVVTSTQPGWIGALGFWAGYGPVQDYVNNQMGGIDVLHSNGRASFSGITGGHNLADLLVQNNHIGYAAAPIRTQGTGIGNTIVGIDVNAGASLQVVDNTVAYLNTDIGATFSSTGYIMSNFSILGISAYGGMGLVEGNTVHSLTNTHAGAATSICGIQADLCTSITRNQVHSLGLATNSSEAVMIGINLLQGNAYIGNNMVRLGHDLNGQSVSQGMRIFGMRNLYAQSTIEHNSIYIGGSNVTDTASTYALYTLSNYGNRKILNNIFYNGRSNGSGTGSHYAIMSGGSSVFPESPPLSDGNDFHASGIGGKVGRYAGSDQLTIFDWRLASGQDFNSISHDPNFLNPTGNALLGDLHIGPVTPIDGIGVAGAGVVVDIDGQNRGPLTPRDLGADAGNFTPLAVQQPEAYLSGNALLIPDGDVTPAAADGTDFGTTVGCSMVSRNFVLRNIGNANLLLSGMSVGGSSAFVVLPPVTGTLTPGQSQTIVLQFTPTTPGLASATITLLTNDQDESSYSFDVQGIGGPDTTAPVAVCQYISAPIAANGLAVVDAAALGAGSTDNCAVTSYVASPAQFSCAQIGTQAVTLTVADAGGQTATCNASVTVVDQLAPVATCQNTSLVLGVGGIAQLTPAALDGGSTDNCGIDSMWVSDTTFTCAEIGPNAVQLSVRDAAGHVANCTGTVTITEGQAPTALCQPATLLLDTFGQAQLSPGQLDAGSSDNCSSLNLALSQGLFTCVDVGVQPVVLTVTDGSGNAATCSTQVTVQDLAPPVLTCADLTLTVPGSSPATLTPSLVGTATDVCGIASYTLSQTQFSCANVGTFPIQLIAWDPSGNSDTCEVVLTAVLAPLAASVSASSVGPCGHALACAGQANAFATATVSGACAPYTYTWSNGQTGATATGLGAGTYSVTVQAAGGQMAVQSITLTAPDPLSISLSSTPTCPNSNPSGSLTASVTGGQSCQSYSYLWSNGATSASISGLAAGTYTLSVTDAAGCSSQASTPIAAWPNPGLSITLNGPSLQASPGFVSYLWFDTTGTIPGATGVQFTPGASGLYHVVAVDSNGCTWSSAAFPFVYVGNAGALQGWTDITLYPNPGAGVFRFAVGQAIYGPIWLSVTDLSGKVLLREELAVLESGRAFDLAWVAAGVYLVELRAADGVQRRFRWLRK